MSLWSISYLLPPLVSLTLSHTHVWPGHQEKKKKRVWILEKVKVLLQQEDYHYGYWGISYKECGPPLTYLSLFYWFAGNIFYGQSRSKKGHWSGKENGTTFVRSPGKINYGIWGALCVFFFFKISI